MLVTNFSFSPNHGKSEEGGVYQGEVITLKSVSTDGKDRRCRCTDGDEEDLHLNEIKKYNKASPYTYNPSCRSTRKRRASSKASVNITIEQMTEIQATLLRLKIQKEQATTLKRSLDEYNLIIAKQYSLNLPSHAFFTANAVLDPYTGATLEYPQLKLGKNVKEWIRGCSNEIGRLAREVQLRMITASNTIHFIHSSQKPANRTAKYLRIVSSYRPQKEDPCRIRFTVGGN